MKKVLLSAVTVLGLFGAFESGATTIVTTQYGTIPSHVQLDNRTFPRMVQEGLRNSAPGIVGALAAAEGIGYDFSGTTLKEGSFAHGSFVGVDQMKVESGKIQFRIDLSELNSNITGDAVTVLVQYVPVEGSYNQIAGWTCTTDASRSTALGANFVPITGTGLDPLLQGLGYPFAGCTSNTITPIVAGQ